MDETSKIMVQVGPAEDDVLPLGKAEKVLALLLESDPELFAWLVGQAVTGSPPRRPRRRP
jgi:hypothetical protein